MDTLADWSEHEGDSLKSARAGRAMCSARRLALHAERVRSPNKRILHKARPQSLSTSQPQNTKMRGEGLMEIGAPASGIAAPQSKS